MCMLQPDDTVNVAVEKINSLLETFLGISDTELGEVYKNLQPVTTSTPPFPQIDIIGAVVIV